MYSYVSCDYWFVQIVLHHRVAVIVSCKYLKEEVICVKSVFHFHTQGLLSFFVTCMHMYSTLNLVQLQEMNFLDAINVSNLCDQGKLIPSFVRCCR